MTTFPKSNIQQVIISLHFPEEKKNTIQPFNDTTKPQKSINHQIVIQCKRTC